MRSLVIMFLTLGSVASWAKCPNGTTPNSDVINGKSSCILQGTYKGDLTLTPEYAWILEGRVDIGGDKKNNGTLTLKEGTVVYGRPKSFLVITRDSKIFVQGSATKPVVMTSLNTENPLAGDWGGLVITGNARTNDCKDVAANGACSNTIEGVAADIAPRYGGNNDEDSSGEIRYLRVEYAGQTFLADSELNAITLYTVGRKTTIEYIQAYKGADDGVELFGGTVNLKYVSAVDNDDDGFDWSEGWRGAAQFIYVELEDSNEKDPRGIEADSHEKNFLSEPRSNPTISNVTIVGKGPKPVDGIMLRRGTGGEIYNTIVIGDFKNCFNVDNNETFENAGVVVGNGIEQTGLVMQNSILQCSGTIIAEDPKDLWSLSKWFESEDRNNYVMAMNEKVLEDGIPVANGAAVKTGYLPPDVEEVGFKWGPNFKFLQVDYVGAYSPNGQKWSEGWTQQ